MVEIYYYYFFYWLFNSWHFFRFLFKETNIKGKKKIFSIVCVRVADFRLYNFFSHLLYKKKKIMAKHFSAFFNCPFLKLCIFFFFQIWSSANYFGYQSFDGSLWTKFQFFISSFFLMSNSCRISFHWEQLKTATTEKCKTPRVLYHLSIPTTQHKP